MKMKMEAMSPRSVGSPHSMKMEDAPTPPPPNNLKRPLPPPPQMPLPPPPSVDSGIANPELQSFSSAVSQSLHLQNIDYKMNWHGSQVRLIKFLDILMGFIWLVPAFTTSKKCKQNFVQKDHHAQNKLIGMDLLVKNLQTAVVFKKNLNNRKSRNYLKCLNWSNFCPHDRTTNHLSLVGRAIYCYVDQNWN